MKKYTLFLMAWALVMTMSQCKKEVQVSPDNSDESVTITLKVKGSTASRSEVNPTMGTVSFEEGDVVYVASGGKYVGTLTYNEEAQFSGVVSNAIAQQPLHFYYLGNVTPSGNLESGVTTSCMIDISDQSGNQWEDGTWHLPVISYAPSAENYGETTSFTACLQNQCAMAKFRLYTLSQENIYITDVNHKVTVHFDNASFDYDKESNGYINIGKGSVDDWVDKWIILLPQDAVGDGSMGSAYAEDNGYVGIRYAIPSIIENSFLTTGINVVVGSTNGDVIPTGAVSGKFSVSEDQQVYFSQGNLQYQASTNTWRFAEHQYDYVGLPNSNISSTYDGWIDLFGWGTGNNPTQISGYFNDFNEWGDNLIINGGTIESGWHTLTYNEWNYVLNSRNSSEIRYAKAMLNGVNGLLLLPDDWQASFYTLNRYNESNAPYSSNVLDADWDVLQNRGVVFLPAAGERLNNNIGNNVINVNAYGVYWSKNISTPYNAYCMYYYANSVLSVTSFIRSYGASVRLVQNCPEE